MNNLISSAFVSEIKDILHSAKNSVYQIINSTMTKTYWEIGKKIVEEEQEGKKRAQYGKTILKILSHELTKEFGKGFSVANLKNMRQFYIVFEKRQTLSSEFKLSYSHYIFLSRIKNMEKI
jgi:translation initiation factor 2 alpha subunit (eIF-2alpha)